MVGSRACGRVVRRSRVVLAGGSSRVLRKMLAAAVFMRSHSWMSATFHPPAEADTWTLPMRSRVASAPIWRALPAGRRWKQSGWAPSVMERRRSAAVAGGLSRRSARARPTPRRRSMSSPVMSRLWERRPRSRAWSMTAVAGESAKASGQGRTEANMKKLKSGRRKTRVSRRRLLGFGRLGFTRGGAARHAISFCTAVQTSLAMASSVPVPSITWKRSGMLSARRR